MPVFYLQIVEARSPYPVVRIPGGGVLERDLVKTCTEAIVAKGVGIFKTEAFVKKAIMAGITEAITELKRESRFVASA